MANELTVTDLPAKRNGEISFVVPKGTLVMKGESRRIYASPGDHIHGYRDRAGISVAVYDGAKCVVCHE